MTRLAALDWGKARIGVSVADELGLLAHPRPPIDARNRRAALDALRALAEEEGITRFVVGLPLTLDGAAGASADKVERFAEQVAAATGREVELVDERLTTVEAHRRLDAAGMRGRDRKERIDGAAATVLLQAYLDGHR